MKIQKVSFFEKFREHSSIWGKLVLRLYLICLPVLLIIGLLWILFDYQTDMSRLVWTMIVLTFMGFVASIFTALFAPDLFED